MQWFTSIYFLTPKLFFKLKLYGESQFIQQKNAEQFLNRTERQAKKEESGNGQLQNVKGEGLCEQEGELLKI